MKALKKLLLALAILLGIVLLCVAALFTWLTITEFRPEAEEPAVIYTREDDLTWKVGYSSDGQKLDQSSFTVLSWNLGYCALGEESDFFMDGGKQVRPEREDWVTKNLDGVQRELLALKPDFCFLQEIDSGSRRSYGIDEVQILRDALGQNSSYALNYSCPFVPIPFPPLGEVHSGLLSFSQYAVQDATRISLPCPFSWPMSIANLKRCLLVSRVPLAGSERELVLVNFHLEAYDDGEGKLAQAKQLREFVEAEYENGNYVVAGGDWNQIFPGAEATYPNTHKELWTPGYLDEAELSEGWRYAWDDAVPTCRLLNQPYDPADQAGTQYYVIDGFLVSPNLRVESVETLDMGFAYSDHNPVLLKLSMGE